MGMHKKRRNLLFLDS